MKVILGFVLHDNVLGIQVLVEADVIDDSRWRVAIRKQGDQWREEPS